MNNIKKVFIIFAAGLTSAVPAFAQDKILYPDISYAGTPRSCIIGGINISGVQGYEDYMLSGISGLQVGQEITVPGADITNAVKRTGVMASFLTFRFRPIQSLGERFTCISR